MPLSHIDELQTFIELIQCRSTIELSKKNKINKTTIWRHIDALEYYLGQKLIYRHPKGFELTDAGANLYNTTFIPNLKFNALKDKPPKTYKSTTILILSSVPTTSHFIQYHLPKLNLQHEKFNIKFLSYSSTLSSQANPNKTFLGLAQGCDLILSSPINQISLDNSYWKKLCTLNVQEKLFASEEYLSKHEKITSIKQLENHSFISSSQMNNQSCKLIDKEGKTTLVQIKGKYSSSSTITRYHMALANLGITAIPETIPHFDMQVKKLINILPSQHVYEYSCAFYKKLNSSKIISDAIDQISQIIIDSFDKFLKQNQKVYDGIKHES